MILTLSITYSHSMWCLKVLYEKTGKNQVCLINNPLHSLYSCSMYSSTRVLLVFIIRYPLLLLTYCTFQNVQMSSLVQVLLKIFSQLHHCIELGTSFISSRSSSFIRNENNCFHNTRLAQSACHSILNFRCQNVSEYCW